METKYYTPEISEFFVGFEYEWYYHPVFYKLIDGKEKTWEKRIYKGDDFIGLHKELGGEWIRDVFQQIKDVIEPKDLIRVKYLDVEDVESLGFGFIEETENGSINFIKPIFEIKHSIHLGFNKKNSEVGISIYDFNKVPPEMYSECSGFRGIIKNKSELKKILQMLNIK